MHFLRQATRTHQTLWTFEKIAIEQSIWASKTIDSMIFVRKEEVLRPKYKWALLRTSLE